MTNQIRVPQEVIHDKTGLRGDVAIVGMACIYPRAQGLRDFWQNVVSGVDAISDMPPERIPPEFYDPESSANDRTYCRRGGFLGVTVPFDPVQFGVMPVVTEGGDPEQLLSLKVAFEALRDAGYDPEHMNGERTQVIIGRGNYANRALSTAQHHVSVVNEMLEVLKAVRADYTTTELARLRQELLAGLPRFGPDNAASLVPNFTTGRIANRFDCMGTNFTVDAACASSLVALEIGVRDLLSGKCDVALAGGAFIISDLTHIAVLTQIQALSHSSEIRPFDEEADGTIPGEGVGILVLKRLEDAQQNGDRIYAVVKGVGTSSDGRGLGLLAPRVEGEELALRRAYQMAGFDPMTIGLIEAHGTGTPTGDATEIQALTQVFGTNGFARKRIAVGTIKSMIGHSLPAAGAAGLIKTALALYQKILPPTLHCEHPNPKLALDETPFYMNTTTRPWIHGGHEHPRRAAVNAFGFGGVNAHVILEEYQGNSEDQLPSLVTTWPTELFILEASDRPELLQRTRALVTHLSACPDVEVKDLAFTLNSNLGAQVERLAVVASSLDDLRAKLERACSRLSKNQCQKIKDVSGIYYFSRPLAREGKLAVLFPGEGAQYLGMLGDLCQHFPVVRRIFDRTDRIASMDLFPPPWPKEREQAECSLWSTISGAAAAVLTGNTALYALFQKLGLAPDAVMGHSSGDFTACLAAGIFSDDDTTSDRLTRLWRIYDTPEESSSTSGLLAVGAAANTFLATLEDLAAEIHIAMDNCPHQSVLAGSADVIERARKRLLASNIVSERLPFNRPYHTQAFSAQLGPVQESLREMSIYSPTLAVYSCTTANLYPTDVTSIRELMIEHWYKPVRFHETIRRMYADGFRIFLELGARGNLTAFVEDILRGESYLAVCADNQRRHGITQLNHVLALLIANGVHLQLHELYSRRLPKTTDLTLRPVMDRHATPNRTLALSPIRLRLETLTKATSPTTSTANPEVASQPHIHSSEASPTISKETDCAAGHPFFLAQSVLLNTPNRQSPALAVTAPAPMSPMNGFSDEADNSMVSYLQTMEKFLSVQLSVMKAFLTPHISADGHRKNAGLSQKQYPLLGDITSHLAGQELRAQRTLTLEDDPFLLDHMFGRKVSVDPALRPIATVPTAVSMEIMAEAAVAMFPGLHVIGMRSIRCSQWINVTERPTILSISAKRVVQETRDPEVQVQVTLWSGEAGADLNLVAENAATEGIVVLSSHYPTAPAASPIVIKDARPCRATPTELYDWLFHGPRFHSISALHHVGADGLSADLRTLPLEGFLGNRTSDPMILDPVLLDGVGQLSAAWVFEQKSDPGIMFPVLIDEITFYGPRYRLPAVSRCHLKLHQCDYRQVHADMDVVEQNGRLHAQVVGWHHYRIHTPPNRIKMSRDARSELSGELWDLPVSPLPTQGHYVASLVDGLSEKGTLTMAEACAYIVLSKAEREQWRTLNGSPNRRAQWLLGRVAIKDAVRVFLFRQCGLELYPADIEVINDDYGRPRVAGAWVVDARSVPAVSLAHTGAIGVAIAGGAKPDDYLGIDIERIRPRDSGFLELAFSTTELVWLEALEKMARWEWATRFWCAKEAVAKAFGCELVDGPRSLGIEQVDWTTGRLKLKVTGILTQTLPELSDRLILAHTMRSGELAVASTICEKEA